MNIQSLYRKGESSLLLQGAAGELEAILQCSDNTKIDYRYLAILGHPHSLYGGTMQNKVISTLARTFQDLGIPSLRFNFRGVGKSQGAYDAGLGESEDLIFIMTQLLKETPQLRFCLAGFSFGAYVTFRAAANIVEHIQCLISVAPAVQHYDFSEFSQLSLPWIIIHGENDEIASPQAVYDWHAKLNPQPKLIKMPDTTHFFHRRLGTLKEHLMNTLPAFLK